LIDLDMTLDLPVLMPPIKMLQWNAATWWLPTPFEPSCWAQTFLSSFCHMLSTSGYALIILWPLEINWSHPTTSLLARKMAYQPCILLAAEFGYALQVDDLPS